MATKQTGAAETGMQAQAEQVQAQADSLTGEVTPAAAAASATYLGGVHDNYSQYVAAGPVNVDGARAFNKGARVPADHPMLGGWLRDGLVVATDQA